MTADLTSTVFLEAQAFMASVNKDYPTMEKVLATMSIDEQRSVRDASLRLYAAADRHVKEHE